MVTRLAAPCILAALLVACDPSVTESRSDLTRQPLTPSQPARSITVDNVVQFTNDAASDALPDMSGNRIVWQKAGDIVLREFGSPTEIPIANTADTEGAPSISGDLVAWRVTTGGITNVMGHNLSTSTTFVIAPNVGAATSDGPDVDGPYVVYTRYIGPGNVDLWLYDHTTGANHPVSALAGLDFRGAVSGNRIVWQGTQSGNSDIYTCLWNAVSNACSAAPTAVASTAANEIYPAVFGDVVAWFVADTDELWMRDLATADPPRRIAGDVRVQIRKVSLSADLLVWFDLRNEPAGTNLRGDIFLYDLAENEEVAVYVDPNRSDRDPVVSGDRIVWASLDQSTPQQDLFVAELSIETLPPIDALRELIDDLASGSPPGITNLGTAESLNTFLDIAEMRLARGSLDLACDKLDAFIDKVEQLSADPPSLITADAATQLVQAAEALKESEGCSG